MGYPRTRGDIKRQRSVFIKRIEEVKPTKEKKNELYLKNLKKAIQGRKGNKGLEEYI